MIKKFHLGASTREYTISTKGKANRVTCAVCDGPVRFWNRLQHAECYARSIKKTLKKLGFTKEEMAKIAMRKKRETKMDEFENELENLYEKKDTFTDKYIQERSRYLQSRINEERI